MACEGIMQSVHKATGFEYYTGLWFPTIHYDLLWRVQNGVFPVTRSQSSRAPSWSWMCMDGRIDYEECPDASVISSPAFDVVQIGIDRERRLRFGPGIPKPSTLLIRGLFKVAYLTNVSRLPALVPTEHSTMRSKPLLLSSQSGEVTEQCFGYMFLDDAEYLLRKSRERHDRRGVQDQSKPGTNSTRHRGLIDLPVVCLKAGVLGPYRHVGFSLKPRSSVVAVLVLWKGDINGPFERIGMGYVLQADWFDDTIMAEETLI
jgi:hypothetical protein